MPHNKESLIGNTYGDLIVIGDGPSISQRSTSICICSCGKRCTVKNKYLKNGDTKSCGHRHLNQKQPDFIPGQIFQELTVISKLPHVRGKKPRYLVECSCGSQVEKSRIRLLKDRTCGSCKAMRFIGRQFNGSIVKDYLGYERFSVECKCGEMYECSRTSLNIGSVMGCSDCSFGLRYLNQDISGMVFNMLEVQYLWQSRPNLWLCICDCGNSIIRPKAHIISGNIKSCGCLGRVGAFGDLNVQWKGGVKTLNSSIRDIPKYHNWRSSVFERDNYTCQVCNIRGSSIQAHHIIHLSELVKRFNVQSIEDAKNCSELWDIKNGKTLCVECHTQEHNMPGILACHERKE